MAYTTIKSLLVATCDAIRDKLQTTELIAAQDIPEKIGEITGGGGSTDPIDDVAYLFYKGKRIDNYSEFIGRVKIIKDLSYFLYQPAKATPPIDIKALLNKVTFDCTMSNAFACDSSTKKNLNIVNINEADFSQITSLNSTFSYLYCVQAVSIKNLSKCTTVYGAFQYSDITSIDFSQSNNKPEVSISYLCSGCTQLTDVNLKGVGKITQMSATFQGCSKLKNISFEDVDMAGLTGWSGAFTSCDKLEEITGLEGKMTSNYIIINGSNTSVTKFRFKLDKTWANPSTTNELTLNLVYLRGLQADEIVTMAKGMAKIVPKLQVPDEWVDEDGNVRMEQMHMGKRTIKVYTNTYNAMTDEQKNAVLAMGYGLSYGTS